MCSKRSAWRGAARGLERHRMRTTRRMRRTYQLHMPMLCLETLRHRLQGTGRLAQQCHNTVFCSALRSAPSIVYAPALSTLARTRIGAAETSSSIGALAQSLVMAVGTACVGGGWPRPQHSAIKAQGAAAVARGQILQPSRQLASALYSLYGQRQRNACTALPLSHCLARWFLTQVGLLGRWAAKNLDVVAEGGGMRS